MSFMRLSSRKAAHAVLACATYRKSGISLVFREMWDSTAAEPPVLGPINKTIKVCGIPHLAKNERDTRISSTRRQARATCAAFIEESRIKLVNAIKLHRKSGLWGTRHSWKGQR